MHYLVYDTPKGEIAFEGKNLADLFAILGSLVGAYSIFYCLQALDGSAIEISHQTTYRCSSCGHDLTTWEIPAEEGELFDCPKCDNSISA